MRGDALLAAEAGELGVALDRLEPRDGHAHLDRAPPRRRDEVDPGARALGELDERPPRARGEPGRVERDDHGRRPIAVEVTEEPLERPAAGRAELAQKAGG
ncbi:MAG: hypothetical protein MUF34_11980 [Polyangiaceae bacterium]|nr:hypothetical protein [Polyangiaceae bacterium]